MHAIETQGLTKDFGQGRGVFDLDLAIEPGRVHGFLGPNGAGKTTAIRLLLDYIRPTRGSARVLGHAPGEATRTLHRQIGFVPGELALPGNITGQRYLDDAARLHGGIDDSWRDHLVKLFDARPDDKIRTLSKGNRQKIALIDALQHQPRLLIMDEPTDGLDPLLRAQVLSILRRHTRRGGTVFLSSHVVNEVQTICDDVTVLLSGRLRLQASVDELLADEPARVEATVPDVAAAVAALKAAGVAKLQHKENRVRFQTGHDLLAPMATLAGLHASDVRVHQADLEDRFLAIYQEERR